MRRAFLALFALTALGLLAGFAGPLHGAGDTIALARPVLAPILAILSLVALSLRPRWLGAGGLALSLVAGVSLLPPLQASQIPDGTGSYSAYQKNLLWIIPSTDPVADDILETEADFVTLQELHKRNRSILAQLRKDYPHQHFCPFRAVGGTAVLSRWPSTGRAPICDDGYGLAAMEVETPDGPLWVVSLHLHWPYPYGQSRQLDKLLPVLGALDGPVVLGGDFNMVPWAHSVAAVKHATRTASSGYAGGTFVFSYNYQGRNLARFFPRIPIDHVLVPERSTPLSLERRDRIGSDHHGLFATFALTAP